MCIFLIWMTAVLCASFVQPLTWEMEAFHNPYKEAVQKSPLVRQRAHGYLQVRPGVHLFYQLYYANGTKAGAPNKPLLIWIQGGPGFAASGIGSFGEIGPLNMKFEPRNHTWVKKGNVLLIDHPVGAGFSYATNESLFVKTDREMATDLSRAIRMFLRRRKEFRNTPTYIIGQSYGGKITPRLALYLYTAIKKKDLQMNFKGIGIGGGWVNPRESTLMQPDLLYHVGAIDRDLYLKAKKISLKMVNAIDKHAYTTAAHLDDQMFRTLQSRNLINFNNYNRGMPFDDFAKLTSDMNYYVKPTLRNVNQTIKWKYICEKAYHNLKKTFTMPSYSFLETLLNNSNLKIAIYNGNLDIVTPIAGASNWVHKLNWHGAANFSAAPRNEIDGIRNGFYKEWDRLSFWWVFGAGHWVIYSSRVLEPLPSEDELKVIPPLLGRHCLVCSSSEHHDSRLATAANVQRVQVPEDNPEAMDHILRYLMKE